MYDRVKWQENTHDGSIYYQKRKTLAKITTEVRNTYICHKTKYQEIYFQHQLIQLKFN